MPTYNKLANQTRDGHDEWEIDYFTTDPYGLRLAEPVLGVRVNGGTWIEARALVEAIQEVGRTQPPPG